MQVEVVYALADQQCLLRFEVANACTVQQAILQSGILQQFPELDLQKNPVGICGQQVELGHLLREHDRIEIYRPLVIDPKEARRLRAQGTKSKRVS